MHEELYDYKDKLFRELRDQFSAGALNIDVIEKITHSMASICKMINMEEEKHDSQMYGRPMSPIYYDDGMNVNRMGGRYDAGRHRDSMGRYATGEEVSQLRSMMESSNDERVRQALQRTINEMEGR